jgi:hypothetical protein
MNVHLTLAGHRPPGEVVAVSALPDADLFALADAFADRRHPNHQFGMDCVGELVFRAQFDLNNHTAMQWLEKLGRQKREAYHVYL